MWTLVYKWLNEHVLFLLGQFVAQRATAAFCIAKGCKFRSLKITALLDFDQQPQTLWNETCDNKNECDCKREICLDVTELPGEETWAVQCVCVYKCVSCYHTDTTKRTNEYINREGNLSVYWSRTQEMWYYVTWRLNIKQMHANNHHIHFKDINIHFSLCKMLRRT